MNSKCLCSFIIFKTVYGRNFSQNEMPTDAIGTRALHTVSNFQISYLNTECRFENFLIFEKIPGITGRANFIKTCKNVTVSAQLVGRPPYLPYPSVRPCNPADKVGRLNPFFLIHKQSGKMRFILNLKELNKSVTYNHFKMSSISDAMKLLKYLDFMIKIDLTSAYDCVPMHEEDQTYLQFVSKGQLFQFTCFPNGLSEAPRLFTRLLDPIKYTMGKLGIRFISYLDDLLLMNQDQHKLVEQASIVIQLFVNLGFVINTSKSVTSPTQCLEFLGFILNSVTMKVSLPSEKLEKIQSHCISMINKNRVRRRALAVLVGLMTSASLAISPAPLHYRALQRMIIEVADHNNWEAWVPMSIPARKDLLWWIQESPNWISSPIIPPVPQLVIKTDASLKG